MARHLMRTKDCIEELYEIGHTLDEEDINERIQDIYNNIRNMIRVRREAEQRIAEYCNLSYPEINKKILSNEELSTHCHAQCSICFETHKKVDSLTTDCNHDFGFVCYNNWIRRYNNCPICRHTCKSVTTYIGKDD